jgi:hypothetical protein
MAAPPLSDEDALAAANAYLVHGSQFKAAAALGLSRATFQNRLNTASMRGFLLKVQPAMPGYVIKETSAKTADGTWVRQAREPGEEFAVPAGHVVKGVSALLDQSGRELAKWVKTRQGEIDPLAIADALKASFANFKPAAKPVAKPKAYDTDLLTLFPANDWHIGMFAWEQETGENWDLKIAEQVIGQAVEDTLARAPASNTAIILGGGDLLHADNNENQTARSSNALDVDGRYQKVVETACRLMVRTVQAALARNGHVIVRILPGNHDEHSAVAVTYFLHAWFRNEPRVQVDCDASQFFWHRFGAVMLGATHGHMVKVKDMPSIMAHRRASDWGTTRYRYVHGFHLHHSAKIATEGNGVVCEVHQAPIPQDAYHYGSGYLSGRSLQAITYHGEFGEIGRVRTAILDGKKAA